MGSTTPVFQIKNGFPIDKFTPDLVELTDLMIRAQDSARFSTLWWTRGKSNLP